MTILCYYWIIISRVENHKYHNFAKLDDYSTPAILTTPTIKSKKP